MRQRVRLDPGGGGLRVVVDRLCRFRVTLCNPADGPLRITVLDGGGSMIRIYYSFDDLAGESSHLLEGRTSRVLAAGMRAAFLSVERADGREERVPLHLHPDTVTVLRL